MIKKLFIDLETTGTDPRKHSIHQIAGMVEINDEIIEEFNWEVAPHPKAQIEPEALRICGITEDDLMLYPPMEEIHGKMVDLLGKYAERFNPKDKFFLVHYNGLHFDEPFLQAWFHQNKNDFMMSWFFAGSLDVMALAAEYLIHRRANMPSFKLKRVCLELGLDWDQEKAHNALYDITKTREIYRIVTGREVEI